uniref:Uncharacterized protein n=1 Tax=Cajanus cajan TaxID=3821 RepID=A0A151SF06_CAJCA|nr:hypothetical protein KK1_024558 [Cajanus cajan]
MNILGPFPLAKGQLKFLLVEMDVYGLKIFTVKTITIQEEALSMELDLIDEVRDRALINMEACRTRLARQFRTKVKQQEFQLGDLVWRVTRKVRKN